MPRPLLGRQEHPPSQRPRQQIHRQPPPYRPRNPRTPLPHRPRPHPQHPQPHGYRPHHRRTFVHRSLSINTRLVIHHRPHPTRLLSAAQVFPMIGTRFRRFPMIGSQFRGFFQPLEPGFPPAFLPLSSRRARLEAAPPEGGLSASGVRHLAALLVGRAVPASRFPSPGSAGTPRPTASYHLPLFLPHSSRGGGDATLNTASRTLKSAFAPSTLRRPQVHFSALFPAVHAHFSGNHLLAFLLRGWKPHLRKPPAKWLQ